MSLSELKDRYNTYEKGTRFLNLKFRTSTTGQDLVTETGLNLQLKTTHKIYKSKTFKTCNIWTATPERWKTKELSPTDAPDYCPD